MKPAPLALLLVVLCVSGTWAGSAAPAETNAPPANVGKVSQEDWNSYCKWAASIPADQQAWEKMLQKYLGGYYFPIYLKGRLAGTYTLKEPGDWGFVADDPALPRVLLIGDSISHMYTDAVRKSMKGKANVHRAPANCGPTDAGLRAMDDWLAEVQGPRWDIIHFNFGIHDRKKTAKAYAANLEKLVARLKNTGAVLVWARTTPFANDPNAQAQCKMLNETADAVMTQHGIKINDLYSTVAGDLDKYISGDKVHFNQHGVKVQAEQVASVLNEIIHAQNELLKTMPKCPTPQRITRQQWIDYQKLVASLPADEQEWERQHQKYQGFHGLAWYIAPRLRGAYTPKNPGLFGYLHDDPALPRVMIIGDSISLGYTLPVRKLLEGKANVHRPPANCGSTDLGLKGMDDWLGTGKWDVIHFNFGLHDRRKKAEQYRENLERVVQRLEKTGATLIWARTTPCDCQPEAVGQVQMLNEVADEIMKKHNVRINDFFGLLAPEKEKVINSDRVHFNGEASKAMAEMVAKSIAEAIQAKK